MKMKYFFPGRNSSGEMMDKIKPTRKPAKEIKSIAKLVNNPIIRSKLL